jgi:hypothetical protein
VLVKSSLFIGSSIQTSAEVNNNKCSLQSKFQEAWDKFPSKKAENPEDQPDVFK